jgi:F-type H+-transporting ATPase subunit alpha
MNQNLSKLSKLISFIWLINWYCLILCSHSSSSSLLSYTIPLIGISIAERLRDRGFDTIICFDDFSKHSKSYRQISLILAKIPSRDAFPSDIFNIHASILERCGKLKLCYFNGSITAFPIIETIANDITEYIATNIISITDGQLYTNKKLFLDSCRPSIDSALSVSRIGSNAQCKLIKIISVGLKNELTNYRIMELSSNSFDFFKLLSLNQMKKVLFKSKSYKKD